MAYDKGILLFPAKMGGKPAIFGLYEALSSNSAQNRCGTCRQNVCRKKHYSDKMMCLSSINMKVFIPAQHCEMVLPDCLSLMRDRAAPKAGPYLTRNVNRHMSNALEYRLIKPDDTLRDFVYCFSSLKNLAGFSGGVIVPNGKIDLLLCKTTSKQFQIMLMGLETKPKPMPERGIDAFFAISFNPLAIEYIFQQPIAGFIDSGKELPDDFWGFRSEDLDDFEAFCEKASQKIRSLLPEEIDARKRKLFELIFATDGGMNIRELAEQVGWSERQINRYFNQQLGLSLKTYCTILRFQASLHHIKDGKLAPQLNFTDQSHFIREIKKLSGVSPKELFRNQNDRFLQFLVYHTR